MSIQLLALLISMSGQSGSIQGNFSGTVLPCLKAWLGSGTGDPTGTSEASSAFKPTTVTGAPNTPNGHSEVAAPQIIRFVSSTDVVTLTQLPF